ncbi:hypothetical protein Anas_06763 [Armadillidium nasatum]|uniref:Uncharacterized protein n=1 Tax=Armadillidium nasatum TaxID=96803 RepID=A0A5N5SQ39_9CRUS|nr:hypothetical protein Anas_06763 [Armadillidium nasatum]
MCYPSLHSLLSKWIPKQEFSRFIGSVYIGRKNSLAENVSKPEGLGGKCCTRWKRFWISVYDYSASIIYEFDHRSQYKNGVYLNVYLNIDIKTAYFDN